MGKFAIRNDRSDYKERVMGNGGALPRVKSSSLVSIGFRQETGAKEVVEGRPNGGAVYLRRF